MSVLSIFKEFCHRIICCVGCGFVLQTILSKRVLDSLMALGNISVFQDIALVILYALIVCSNSSF